MTLFGNNNRNYNDMKTVWRLHTGWCLIDLQRLWPMIWKTLLRFTPSIDSIDLSNFLMIHKPSPTLELAPLHLSPSTSFILLHFYLQFTRMARLPSQFQPFSWFLLLILVTLYLTALYSNYFLIFIISLHFIACYLFIALSYFFIPFLNLETYSFHFTLNPFLFYLCSIFTYCSTSSSWLYFFLLYFSSFNVLLS